MTDRMEEHVWWGFAKDHGWVVLDRGIAVNKPGLETDLLFCRCSDSTTYREKRNRWVAPYYLSAQLFIQSLVLVDSEVAAEEHQACKDRWPEFREVVAKQYGLMESVRLERERSMSRREKDGAHHSKPVQRA